MAIDADVLESALARLKKAGSRGLSAGDLAVAVILDMGLTPRPADRLSFGFEIGLALAQRGFVLVTHSNRFVIRV